MIRDVDASIDDLLRTTPIFARLGAADRQRLGAVAKTRVFSRGEKVFDEGDPPEHLSIVTKGRVKVFKTTPGGKDIILELFGPGDPLGAVALYEGRPYPASAMALEDTTCVLVPRQAFFELLEQHPSLVRGLLIGLTHRLVELTARIAEVSGGRVEPRFARLFLKLGGQMGQPQGAGVFVPMPLSRQELADLMGTTIETAIRIMSRWNKQNLVQTRPDGFLLVDRAALEKLARE
jgi:CRP-like cAMP-binding protein